VGWIVVVVIVAVVGVVGGVLWARSRKSAAPAPDPTPERVSRVTDATPMTGLEVALDQATDRSGKNMREKIETDTEIGDLIVPDDTGPILRRALDNVEHQEPAPPAVVPEATPDATTAEPAGGETPASEG
jgi:hypothetical protein